MASTESQTLKNLDDPPSQSPGLSIASWILAIAFSGVMVFNGLDACSLQHWDEGAYTAGPLGFGPYHRETIVPFYAPPLFPGSVAFAFSIFEMTDTVAIATAAIPGFLAILLTGWLAARLFGWQVGVITSILLASSEYYLAYCRMALTDLPYVFLFVLSLLTFHKAIRASRPGLFVLGGLFSGFTLLVKYHGFLPFAMAGLYMLVAALGRFKEGVRPGWEAILQVVRNTLWTLVGFVGPVIFLIHHIHDTVGLEAYAENRAQWMPGVGLFAFKASAHYFARALYEWMSPLLLVFAALGTVAMVRTRGRDVGYFACWAVPFAIALAFYTNYPRLILPLIPAIAILAAFGAVFLSRSLPDKPSYRLALPMFVVLIAGHGAWRATETLSIEANGYEEAAKTLQDLLEDNDKGLLLAQHNVFFYVLGQNEGDVSTSPRFLSHNEDAGKKALEVGDFDYLLVDLRLEHAPTFEEYFRDGPPPQLELVATLDNPLYEMTVVNSGGFDLLDQIRSQPDSPLSRHATTIQIYRHKR